MLTIIKIFLVFCVAEFVHANAMPLFTSVKDSTICSRGYEPITSTWQACKAAAKWHGTENEQIIFVADKLSGTAAYPPGCYWQFNNGKSYRMFCHLKKGDIYFCERHANYFSRLACKYDQTFPP